MSTSISLASAVALAIASAPARAAELSDPPSAPAGPASAASSTSSTSPRPPSSATQAPAEPDTASASPGAASLGRVEVKAARQRLDAARSTLAPETGSTVYRFDRTDIAKLPQGDATPLNQVLLQAPGVVADSYGQLHVRGDHGNLQYRLNGVILPEAISGFGQALDARFADNVNVLTGALPAQYGYRTAGVVDIRTKGTDLANGGSLDLVLGSRGHRETSLNVGGTAGDFQYFLSGSYLQNRIGIENPTPASSAIHDDTRQAKGFAYLSALVGQGSRVSLMLGTAQSRFQIPDVSGQSPSFALAGAAAPDSAALDANQRETNTFTVLTFQSSLDDGVDYQVSAFNRASTVHYRPDLLGDLAYRGVAADIQRRNVATGLQADFSKPLGTRHTLRAGLFLQHERVDVASTSAVFPADAAGNPTSDMPLQIGDASRLGGNLYGVYVQDEWQPTAALTVNYGLRYDRVDTVVAESQWSPRLGVVYQVGETTRVHAGYARYFTPPPTETIDTTSVQKFLGTTNALPSDANTAVRSERANYFDLGVSHLLTPRITLGADAYYRQVDHLQDEGQFGNALIFSSFNYRQGRVYGLELSGSYRGDRLTGYANLALGAARAKGIESGQFNFSDTELAYLSDHWVHLDHEQTLTASAGLSYRFDDGTVLGGDALSGSGLRNGFANTGHLPPYVQVNASLARTVHLAGLGRLDLRLAVLNLFDRSYELRDGSGIGVGAPQFGPRRAVYLTASKPFTF